MLAGIPFQRRRLRETSQMCGTKLADFIHAKPLNIKRKEQVDTFFDISKGFKWEKKAVEKC